MNKEIRSNESNTDEDFCEFEISKKYVNFDAYESDVLEERKNYINYVKEMEKLRFRVRRKKDFPLECDNWQASNERRMKNRK